MTDFDILDRKLRKILVAEDNPMGGKVLEHILKTAGFTVKMVTNGEEALQAFNTDHYDVLLTDWMMPKMNGLELIQAIQTQVNPQPYKIMLTAIDSEQQRELAISSAKIDDYFIKPYDAKKIVTRIDELLAQRH